MIMLDTHVFVWWIHRDDNLSAKYQSYIQKNISRGLGVSIISFWEISKLVEKGRLTLSRNLGEWMTNSLRYEGIHLLDLNIEIICKAHEISKDIHRDPVDQLIIATAVVNEIPILTLDKKIIQSEKVEIIKI